MHRRSACGNPLYFPWDVGKQACSSLYLPNYHTESIYYSTISRIPPLFSRWANGPWSRTVWTLSLAQWRKYMQHPLLVFVFLCCRDQQRFSFRYILLRLPYFLNAYWFELLVTIDLLLIFEKSSLKNQVWKIKLYELDFLSILNLIFTACVACKNQVRNRQKIKFILMIF